METSGDDFLKKIKENTEGEMRVEGVISPARNLLSAGGSWSYIVDILDQPRQLNRKPYINICDRIVPDTVTSPH